MVYPERVGLLFHSAVFLFSCRKKEEKVGKPVGKTNESKLPQAAKDSQPLV
jgi:hypothetical protein